MGPRPAPVTVVLAGRQRRVTGPGAAVVPSADRAVRQRDRRLVVHLEGQGERCVSGQPEPAHRAVPAQRTRRAHRKVRWFRLAGHAPRPVTFEMDDEPPVVLTVEGVAGH